jgi:ribonucleotide monophosphatase NagD (HAD superfamily)
VATNERVHALAYALDPHALDQLSKVVPGGIVRDVPASAELTPGDLRDLDLLVVDLDRAALPRRLPGSGRPKIIGLLPAGASDAGVDPRIDLVLRRPVLPAEVEEALASLFGLHRPVGGELGRWRLRVHHWIAGARLAAVVLAAVLELVPGATGVGALILGLSLAYAGLRARVQGRPPIVWIEVAFVAALVALTGGADSSYFPLALVTVVEVGFLLGVVRAFAAGLVISLAGLPFLVLPQVDVWSRILLWILLHPLAGVAGGLAADVWAPREPARLSVLRETNRLLRDVHGVARIMPSGFDLRSVAVDALDAVRARTGSPAALMFVDDAAKAVLVGWYPEFTMADLEGACHAVWGGAKLYSSSQSLFFASADGKTLGTSRAICAMIKSVTGCRLEVVGKPSLHALRAAGTRLGVRLRDLAVVGDDPMLEVPMAHRGRAFAVAVNTGVGESDSFDHVPGAQAPHLSLHGVGELLALCQEVTGEGAG